MDSTTMVNGRGTVEVDLSLLGREGEEGIRVVEGGKLY